MFLDPLKIHSKIEGKVERLFICPVPPTFMAVPITNTLPTLLLLLQLMNLHWHVIIIQASIWHKGSFLVLYILWVWTKVQTDVHFLWYHIGVFTALRSCLSTYSLWLVLELLATTNVFSLWKGLSLLPLLLWKF